MPFSFGAFAVVVSPRWWVMHRARLPAVTARNPNIQISAKVASHHGSILRKDYHAIAEAVREVAALDHGGTEDAAVTVNPARGNPDSRRSVLAQVIPMDWQPGEWDGLGMMGVIEVR